ncbi:MAG: type II toxin-antitoxin system HicB family antitoxin [Patescibacteria group bacterium]
MSKTRQKIYQYTAVFERNEDNGYTVTVPSLPGLVTEGKDLKEARNMAEDAIRCYVEGLRKDRQVVPQENEVGSFRLSVSI